MAAGLVTKTVGDGNGGTFSGRFWSSDGTTAGLLYPAPVLVDSSGTVVNYGAAAPVFGSIAQGSAASDPPVFIGGRASTANPTAVTDGQVVDFRADKTGRLSIVPHQVRDLVSDTNITITASTAATDLITAGAAGVFNDIISITLNNSSSSDSVVQILNADGTTVRWTGTAKANDVRGIVFPVPLKNAASAAKWTAKTITSVSSVQITVQYLLNI